MREFTDKVVLITGAGKGMGHEVALAFSSLGAIVALNDINPLGLDETVDKIVKTGGKARFYLFDIAKRMPVEGLVAQVLDHFDRIDFLINHASVKPRAPLLEMDEWELHRTLDVNLAGAFLTMQQVGRVMRQQGGGAIVNIFSSAFQGDFQEGHSAFLASQIGLIGLTQSAARELSAYSIRVNAVCNGLIEALPFSIPGWDASLFNQWLGSATEIQRGDYHGLVSEVLFLCSRAGSSLNGRVIACGSEG